MKKMMAHGASARAGYATPATTKRGATSRTSEKKSITIYDPVVEPTISRERIREAVDDVRREDLKNKT